jgi:hypothetical protein
VNTHDIYASASTILNATTYIRFVSSHRDVPCSEFDALGVHGYAAHRGRSIESDQPWRNELTNPVALMKDEHGTMTVLTGHDQLDVAYATRSTIAYDVYETTVDPPSWVLVIGMAFVKTSYIDKCHTRTGTTDPYVRDRRRLLALERDFHVRVISVNSERPAIECEPDQHVETSIGRRSNRSIMALREKLKMTRPFSAVFVDYFRMPSDYMRPIITTLFSECIDPWIKTGIISDSTRVYLPNEIGLHETFYPTLTPRFQCTYTSYNPLSIVSERAYQDAQSSDMFGGCSNADALAQHSKTGKPQEFDFICVQIRTDT